MKSSNLLIFGILFVALLVVITSATIREQPQEQAAVNERQPDVLEESTESTKAVETTESMEIQTQNTTKSYSSAPEMQLGEGVDYKAVIKTSLGDLTVDLFEKESPITVNNFVTLAIDGFYDGIIFHRIIKDFMIQGGDPQGTGSGGPGYSFADEFNDVPLVRGSLAMANAGPNTNGSQFFVVTIDATPWLDGKHTNFGQITEGLDILDKIEGVETGPGDKPLEDIVIESIEIIED